MAKQSIVVLAALVVCLLAGSAVAQSGQDEPQDEPQAEQGKDFNLIVGGELEDEIVEELVETVKYIPAIEKGAWSLSMTLGFFNMTETLLAHPNLIYKATDEALFYADVSLENKASFNPIVRIGYNLTTWLALELQGGITFSEYEAELTNPRSVSPEGGAVIPVTEVGEFDAEVRSSTIIIGNLNALVYPFNLNGDGTGRWHPYLTGGAGFAAYSLDSDYVDDPSSGLNVNFGLGLKLIADDLISLRLEILYQFHTIQFEPAEFFDSQDSGTKVIPIYEFDDSGRFSEVQGYSSQDLGGLVWQIGFSIAF